jgi:hypothetical protein
MNYAKGSRCHGCVDGLRHCAADQNVVGSIPDKVIRSLNLPNPSSRTTTLGFTASNRDDWPLRSKAKSAH